MSTTSRVAGAVAAGYALGRFKKLRLAVLVATAMSSPKFRNAAVGMIQDRIPGGAVVGPLTKEVGGKLVNVGKTAATSIVASRIDTLSQSLAERSQNLRKGAPGGQAVSREPMRPKTIVKPKSPKTSTKSKKTRKPKSPKTSTKSKRTRKPKSPQTSTKSKRTRKPKSPQTSTKSKRTRKPKSPQTSTKSKRTRKPKSPQTSTKSKRTRKPKSPTDEYEEQEDEEAEEPTDESRSKRHPETRSPKNQ